MEKTGLLTLNFLKPRSKPRFGWAEAMVLAIYCGLLLWVIPHHESWLDEAQTWLVARGCSLYELLAHRLHYEGFPALWHLLLWVEVRLGVSFLGMHYIAGLIAAAGIYVWLRYSPLPHVLTLLMPFTYFLQYEYAVIARPYVMCPLFAFLLMAMMQDRKSSPTLYCVMAGLMANCSAHMFAFAAGMVVWYWWDRRKIGEFADPKFRSRSASSMAVFVVFLVAAAAAAWPSPNSYYGGGIANLLRKVTHSGHTLQTGKSGSVMPGSSVAKDHTGAQQENGANPATQGVENRGSNESAGRMESKLADKMILLHRAAIVPVSTSNILAIAFLLLVGLNLWREHFWISATPYVLVLVVFLGLFGAIHHTGLMLVALLCILWGLALLPEQTGRWQLLRPALYAMTLVIAVLQIGWSIYCLSGDIREPFSGAPATARFLETIPAIKRIVEFDDRPDAVNAYLPHSRYANQSHGYWMFSKTVNPDLTADQTMASLPDYVVVPTAGAGISVRPGLAELMERYGYRETHRFCGEHFFRDSVAFEDCLVIYQPGIEPAPEDASAAR